MLLSCSAIALWASRAASLPSAWNQLGLVPNVLRHFCIVGWFDSSNPQVGMLMWSVLFGRASLASKPRKMLGVKFAAWDSLRN